VETPLEVAAGAGVRHRTMAEAALERLREAIIMGELTPGTPLRLEDLARQLGMSISPIREAVRQLEALGLAEHVPHHGAKVMPLDVEELRELFAVRLALEGMAVRRAAELFEPARLAAFAGEYEMGPMRARVRLHGSTLTVELAGLPTLTLAPFAGTRFRVDGLPGLTVEFVLAQGEVGEMVVQPGVGVFRRAGRG